MIPVQIKLILTFVLLSVFFASMAEWSFNPWWRRACFASFAGFILSFVWGVWSL
jgi:hypothetical protein